MSILDWTVLLGTLFFIVAYGIWKTRGSKNIESYLKGNNDMKWWTIGLSIMATQASAITFLSTPGQAFSDGMRFVQFYFGLPLAMVVLSITVIPLYYRLKVYTAYEYLESRFDLKTRTLAAFLFLVQRGLAAGITIYAPAIILSTVLGMDLFMANLLIGFLVILYTVSGGTKAVSQTQKHQMVVIMLGMIVAFGMIIYLLPSGVGFSDALHVAGKMGKMNVIDFSFDWENRYNIWTGLLGGFFLAMSYFGTDQSQVQRYLSGRSITESRLGLLFNGLMKVPLQFFILLVGAMVFVFYQFYQPPVFFNKAESAKVYETEYANEFKAVEQEFETLFVKKEAEVKSLVVAIQQNNQPLADQKAMEVNAIEEKSSELRQEAKDIISKANPNAEARDADYVFITFVMDYLPKGLVGLLLAVIFSAAMSSTSSELNALASTTVIDLYKRSFRKEASEKHYLNASRWFTVGWGVLAIMFATFASMVDNLIQAVNILGSLFYGTILGIFIVAFYFKKIGSNAVFWSALFAEAVVLCLYYFDVMPYLWFNVVGCFLVLIFSYGQQTWKNLVA
ncbi:sodium:solute symporter family transporter [Xanthovirga aplysinae]|uniref:sodium:solute symporter family transporter n=1 Tax=Xanthovirga aplysinae TaxID=2529853 RepID=UPI0012BD3195|nr:sodium:solute symporter [Xanthovirga aplysinae]MTI29877.1 sodium:solute symporter [Xanthovirga aplysinae]